MRLLYLVSRYPLVSQTFIRREIDALRGLGVGVQSASIHRTPDDQVLGADDRAAADSTWVVLGGRTRLLLAHLLELATRPRGYLAAVRTAAVRADGPRGLLWQLFYLLEAVPLLRRCRTLAVRHLHVHFANNAADVARLVVAAGRAIDGDESWSWSFTMHGPTELFDVRRFGLAGKVEDADYVVCISDFARSQLMSLAAVEHWAKLAVVRCGVDVASYEAVAHSARTPLRVLCVGRLVPEKGQGLLVRALAELRTRGHDITLTLVGTGPSADALAAQVEAAGLAGAVRLLGAVAPEDVAALYSTHDAFCLPSFGEGIPIVLMEAMASGLPVLTTRIAGIPELVEDGVSGLLVSAGSTEQLVDGLETLLEPGVRSRLGSAARDVVARRYDLAANVRQLAAVHAVGTGAKGLTRNGTSTAV